MSGCKDTVLTSARLSSRLPRWHFRALLRANPTPASCPPASRQQTSRVTPIGGLSSIRLAVLSWICPLTKRRYSSTDLRSGMGIHMASTPLGSGVTALSFGMAGTERRWSARHIGCMLSNLNPRLEKALTGSGMEGGSKCECPFTRKLCSRFGPTSDIQESTSEATKRPFASSTAAIAPPIVKQQADRKCCDAGRHRCCPSRPRWDRRMPPGAKIRSQPASLT